MSVAGRITTPKRIPRERRSCSSMSVAGRITTPKRIPRQLKW